MQAKERSAIARGAWAHRSQIAEQMGKAADREEEHEEESKREKK